MNQESPASEPFASLAALRLAHAELLKRFRGEGETPEMIALASDFIGRGSATGVFLADDEDRWTAQGLLDYWLATLFRAGAEGLDATLAEFDPSQAEALPDEACPYLGLDAFDETNEGLFFGRQRVVAELVSVLEEKRLVAVIGPSGSGKSSLVRAGLIPALKRGAIAGSARWRFLPPLVPGENPARALKRVLEELPPAEEPMLLIVDQFEETYTLCRDESERTAFTDGLTRLAETGDGHHIVLTMRSDFVPFVARSASIHPLFEAGKCLLPPLTAAEMRDAIESPANRVGLCFEAGVVDDLIQEVLGEPAGLPLLQFTLLRLWEERNRNRVTMAAYKRVGGGRLALARAADECYSALIPEDQQTARRVLLKLVRPAEALEVTSNRVRQIDLLRMGEDPGRIERVLDRLKAARLLRASIDGSGEPQIEVAHEALVRNWPLLVAWLEDARVAMRQRQHFGAAALEWQRLGRPESALLRGRSLEYAESYQDLTPLEGDFVSSSRKTEDEITERALRERDRFRRLARAAWLLALIAIVLAIMTFSLSLRAQRQATTADQQRAVADEQRATAEAAQSKAQTAQVQAQQEADEATRQQAIAETAQTVAVTAQAQSEQQAQLLNIQRLAFAARSLIAQSPELALLLAYEAAAHGDPMATQTLRDIVAEIKWYPLLVAPHQRELITAAWNVDGTLLATASKGGTGYVWEPRSNAKPIELRGHRDEIVALSWRPDGKQLVTVSLDGTARIWEARSGRELAVWRDIGPDVRDVAWSPTTAQIAIVSNEGRLQIWSVGTGRQESSLNPEGPSEATVNVVWSPNGRQVLTASGKTVRVWTASGDSKPIILRGHSDVVLDASWSPEGSRILTAGDRTARIWNARTGQEIAVLKGHTDIVTRASWSFDGQRVATAANDLTARVWDANSGREVAVFKGHTGWVLSVAWSPDGERLVTASSDATARVWTLDGSQPPAILQGHLGALLAARWSPEGNRLVTISKDSTARVWEEREGPAFMTLPLPKSKFTNLNWSPDGKRVLTISEDSTAQVWDADTGQSITIFKGHRNPLRAGTWSPDGGRVLTISEDKTARIWDATSGQQIAVLEGHTGALSLGEWSPDGSRVATASTDQTVQVWEVQSGREIVRLEGNRDPVRIIAWSPDGARILTASGDTAWIWDASTGDQLTPLTGHTAFLSSAVWCPDGTKVLTASEDGTAQIWNVSAQAKPLILRGHTAGIRSGTWSPDGKLVLTASGDGTAQIWQAATGQAQSSLKDDSSLNQALWSPDGLHVLTVAESGIARIWDSKTGQVYAVLPGREAAILSAAWSPEGARILTRSDSGEAFIDIVNLNDLLRQAACLAGRGLATEEIVRFNTPTPLSFDVRSRQCPAQYSWQSAPSP